MCYTEAYTAFGVKCRRRRYSNNAGTLDAIRVVAPTTPSFAVVARASIGHMLPDVVFGWHRVARPSPGGGHEPLEPEARGRPHGMTRPGDDFMVMSFHSAAPARVRRHHRHVPVEITEAITLLVVWKKELRALCRTSRLGQTMELCALRATCFRHAADVQRPDIARVGCCVTKAFKRSRKATV